MNKSNYYHFKQQGLTLIELMVALAVGLTLIAGTLYVFSHTRSAFATNDRIVLMQENARFAFSVMEPDIQLAGFWGKHNDSTFILGDAKSRGPGNPIPVSSSCATNWVLRFEQPVVGANNVDPGWNCIPAGRYLNGTDSISLRRVSTIAVDFPQEGHIYLRSSEAPISEVFIGDSVPTNLPANAENFELMARGYYISGHTLGTSSNNDGIPSLRRVELDTPDGGAAGMFDREIVNGVENMQVQYGVDLDAGVGKRDDVDVYVTADNPVLTQPSSVVRSVRVWLLMRADQEEYGYIDNQAYQLGDVTVPAQADAFRRLVVSKTIFLRNKHR